MRDRLGGGCEGVRDQLDGGCEGVRDQFCGRWESGGGHRAREIHLGF